MRSRALFGLAVLAALVGVAPSNAAINLLTNSFFNYSINNWTPAAAGYVSASWSTPDAHSSSTSGSARLQDYDDGAMSSGTYWIGMRQCVPVTAGSGYHMSGYIGIPSGQSRTGRAAIAVQYYSGNICSGTKLGSPTFAVNTSADSIWHVVSSNSTAPAGAASASINLDIQKDLAGGSFYAYYDEVIFYSTSASGTCISDSTHLCLTDDRFRVSMMWTNPSTLVTQPAHALALASADETGLFYFDNNDNIEMTVKVHRACGLTNNFWIFAAPTTTLEFTITVTDTLTSESHSYHKPRTAPSMLITDFDNFYNCP